MEPTPSDVHVNGPLGNVSIAYVQNAGGFVADRVFPNVPVQKQSDVYFKYDMADWNRDNYRKRAPSTESAGTGWKISTDSYYAHVWALHHDIDDDTRANADSPLDMDRDATIFLTQQALLSREIQWTANFFTTGIWTGSSTGTDLVGSAVNTTSEDLRWNDANSTPIEDVARESDAIKLASGFRPNVLVIGAQVWTALKNHPDIIDRIKYTSGNANPAVVSRQAVAALMELDEILVMDSIQVTSKENPDFETSMTTAFIGGKNALLAYRNPTPSLMMPSAGYTFSWVARVGSSPMGVRILSFRRAPEFKADRVEGEMAYVQKAVATRCGAFWTGIVA